MKSNRLITFAEIVVIAAVVFLNGLIIQTPLPDTWNWKHLDKFSQAIGDVAFLDSYLKRNPSSTEAYVARAKAYAIDGIWTEVVKNYDRAIELDKNNLELYRLRAKALFELDDNERALVDFNRVVDSGTATPEEISIVSMLNTRLGRFETAIADADKALAKHAYWSTAFQARAMAEYELGQFDQAMSDAQKSIEMYKARVIPFVIMAAILNERGEDAKALDMVNEALKRDATCGAAYWQLGVLQDKQKKFDTALSSINYSLSLNTSNEWRAKALAARAIVHLHLNQPRLALDDCNAALKINASCRTAIDTKKQIDSVYPSGKSG